MPAVIPHHAFGGTCCTGSVQDVEGIRGGKWRAADRLGASDDLLPFVVTPGHHLGGNSWPAQHHHVVWPVLGELQRTIDERLVRQHPRRLERSRRGDERLRPGVVDADRQLLRREAAEDDRVHGADARAGEHRDHRLGHHRHVEDDGVALADAECDQGAGETRDAVAQAPVGIGRGGTGHRAVVDQRRDVGAAPLDVPIEAVEAGVQHAAREPAVERRLRSVEDPLRRADPVDAVGGSPPELLGALDTAPEELLVTAGKSRRLSFARHARGSSGGTGRERHGHPPSGSAEISRDARAGLSVRLPPAGVGAGSGEVACPVATWSAR